MFKTRKKIETQKYKVQKHGNVYLKMKYKVKG